MQQFLEKFNFTEHLAFCTGVERERILTNKVGVPVPEASKVLALLDGPNDRFGYELSACQIEDRVGPIKLASLANELIGNDVRLQRALDSLGLGTWLGEVGPEDMTTETYPDPTGRYQEIVPRLPLHVLSAACRVVGTHVHIGMPNHKTALRVYNRLITHSHEFASMGDGSNGERLRLYRLMEPNPEPRPFDSWEDFYACALEHGFAEDPRKCWTWIRISKHGTIEVRSFGISTASRVYEWAARCHELCTLYA